METDQQKISDLRKERKRLLTIFALQRYYTWRNMTWSLSWIYYFVKAIANVFIKCSLRGEFILQDEIHYGISWFKPVLTTCFKYQPKLQLTFSKLWMRCWWTLESESKYEGKTIKILTFFRTLTIWTYDKFVMKYWNRYITSSPSYQYFKIPFLSSLSSDSLSFFEKFYDFVMPLRRIWTGIQHSEIFF